VDWSYRLLDQTGQRVFRAVSVFPGPFTLAAAESVAGEAAGPTVLHLVDCSLLSPPRPSPDGRTRYLMLQTLRAYGARLLADAGEADEAGAALARPGTRWIWPNRPKPDCRLRPGSWPPPARWTPKIPPPGRR
jgi:predicted ATPase